MLRSNPSKPVQTRFVLYVEGPSDCDILRTWARLVSPALSRAVASCAVILGGRRPARALGHFAALSERYRAASEGESPCGICLLDRDDRSPALVDHAPSGLEFFTWERRHIESYLLVPSAIRRSVPRSRSPRLDECLRSLLPEPDDHEQLREIDAKRLLGARGVVARETGVTLSASRIARHMNRSELHAEVIGLLDRVRLAAGVQEERERRAPRAR